MTINSSGGNNASRDTEPSAPLMTSVYNEEAVQPVEANTVNKLYPKIAVDAVNVNNQ